MKCNGDCFNCKFEDCILSDNDYIEPEKISKEHDKYILECEYKTSKKIRECNKKYYQQHKEELKEYRKVYQQQRKEEIKEYKKRYYQQHNEKIRKYIYKYCIAFKDKII